MDRHPDAPIDRRRVSTPSSLAGRRVAGDGTGWWLTGSHAMSPPSAGVPWATAAGVWGDGAGRLGSHEYVEWSASSGQHLSGGA
jgi:hypothetical protein